MHTYIIRFAAILGMAAASVILLGAAAPQQERGVAIGVERSGTDVGVPVANESRRRWQDWEAAMIRRELWKAEQQGRQSLTERESHPPDILEVERAARAEEHVLTVLRWIRQGVDAYAVKDIPMALENLRQAEQVHPQFGKLMGLISLVYGEMGYYTKSLECAQEAVRQEPYDALTQLAMGLAYAHLEDYEKAIASLQETLAREPGVPEAHFILASCYEAQGNLDAAANHRKMYESLSEASEDVMQPESVQEPAGHPSMPMEEKKQEPVGEAAPHTPPAPAEIAPKHEAGPASECDSDSSAQPRESIRLKMEEI